MNVTSNQYGGLLLPLLLLSLIGNGAPVRAAEDDLAQLDGAAAQEALAEIARSVVQVRTLGGPAEDADLGGSPTSGVVLTEDGYIITTAFHLGSKPVSVLVTFPDGHQAPAELVARDHSRDLVLLKVKVSAALPVPVAVAEDEIKVGAWALAVGRGLEGAGANLSIGIVSAVRRLHGRAIQTDAKVSPLNYGGALADIHGRVLGVLVAPQGHQQLAGVRWYDAGVGFAVPLAHVLHVLEKLKTGQDLQPGILGVSLQPGNPYITPATLAAVLPTSPAHEKGLKADDRIVEVDGTPVATVMALRSQLGPRYAGDTVRIAVARGDQRIVQEITLVDRLRPFEHAFLGLLPVRNQTAEKATGVAVRYVFVQGPAAVAGIEPGDVVTALGERPVATWADGLAVLNGLQPGAEVEVQVRRGTTTLRRTVTTGRLPTDIPTDLPPHPQRAAAGADRPPVGTVPLRLPERPNACTLYVPESFDPQAAYGLVVALALPGELDSETLRNQWQSVCDATDLILAVPEPEDPAAWQPQDVAFVRRILQEVEARYPIDPTRVVLHGYQAGGALAYLVALTSRDTVRGLAVVNASLPHHLPLPPNDPVQRLAVYTTRGPLGRSGRLIDKTIRQLREAKYPVTVRDLGPQARYLDAGELAELGRWIDTLDRL